MGRTIPRFPHPALGSLQSGLLLAAPVLSLLAVLASGGLILEQVRTRSEFQQRHTLDSIAERIADHLRADSLQLSQPPLTLAQLTEISGGQIGEREFRQAVRRLHRLEEQPLTPLLELAPDGKVRYSSGSRVRAAQGNYFASPQLGPLLVRALRSERPSLFGPVRWHPDRPAPDLISVAPIRVGGQFWGFSLSMVPLHSFLQPTLTYLQEFPDYRVRLSLVRDADEDSPPPGAGQRPVTSLGGQPVTPFFGRLGPASLPFSQVLLQLHNGSEWLVEVQVVQPVLPVWLLPLGWGLTLLLAALAASYARLLIRQPIRLQREVERQTRELRLLDKAIQASSASVVITDVQLDRPHNRFPIRQVNRSFCELTGYTEAEVIGRSCSFLQGPDSDPDALARLSRQLSAGLAGREVLLNYRKDGTPFWVELTISPVFDDNGQLQAYLGFQIDISERVRAEDQVQRQNRELIEARNQAQAADRAKSEFLATMSHELRTPLHAVIGLSYLLRQSPNLTPEQREQLETIEASSDLLVRIISDILDISRIEDGALRLAREPFDPLDLVEEVMRLLEPQARERGLSLELAVSEPLPRWLLGDPVRVRQIWLNLLGNALKFTERGFVRLQMGYDPEPQLLWAEVSDSGCGISPEQQTHLFTPFRQGDGSLNRRYGGTGLGLAISRKLCQRMQGDLELRRTSPQGTTFALHLTLPEAPAPASEVSPSGLVLLDCRDEALRSHLRLRLERLGLPICEDPAQASDCRHWLLGPESSLVAAEGRSGAPDAVLHYRSPADGSRAIPLTAVPGQQQLAHLLRDAERPAAEGAIAPSWPALRILLAEDNPINQKVTLKLLQRWGLEATVVETGQAVLDRLPEFPFDVVLMDLQMPVMDGLSASRALRSRLGREQHPWVIALTANATTEVRRTCLEAGMDDFLSKPLQPPQLETALRRAAEHLQPSLP